MAVTSMALYRIGNQPDLLRVRSQDVTVFQDPAQGEIWVRAQSATNTPGISCWTNQQAAVRVASGRSVRELPAGSTY